MATLIGAVAGKTNRAYKSVFGLAHAMPYNIDRANDIFRKAGVWPQVAAITFVEGSLFCFALLLFPVVLAANVVALCMNICVERFFLIFVVCFYEKYYDGIGVFQTYFTEVLIFALSFYFVPSCANGQE